MLFNSPVFLFVFLPVTLLGYYLLGRRTVAQAIGWLAWMSLVVYAWWDWRNVPVFLLSVTLNFYAASYIGASQKPMKRRALIAALGVNLLLLAYFKYALFLLGVLGDAVGFQPPAVVGWGLPLGISFFTFTQIAFLVDVYRGQARERQALHYLLFVSFFPHLIAGPILHHAQMMPQFKQPTIAQFTPKHFAWGLTLFAIGLAKKGLLADSLAAYATPVFEVAKTGLTPSFVESWTAALTYSLQLYFDFSGYSDMAVGLGLMCNIRMPQNFHSPYKATSIIDFWRRWHITLSQFLRDYLYIPLGGNRLGMPRRYANLMITMALGGLWHGAGWTFVIWGCAHGVLLSLNHAFRAVMDRLHLARIFAYWPVRIAGVLLTFLIVVALWVIFRAHDWPTALRMLHGMADIHAITLPAQFGAIAGPLATLGIAVGNATPTVIIALLQAWGLVALGLAIVWALPNPYQWMRDYPITCDAPRAPEELLLPLRWKPRVREAWLAGILLGLALLSLTRTSEFLYFQF